MKSSTYQWSEITLTESNRIRSLAILMIIMHNFLHLISLYPGENEFSYSSWKGQVFFQEIWINPLDSLRIIFTYLGHYGVQVFFFLSGYGVALKYRNSSPSYYSFVKKRLFSLYPAILIAACGYLLHNSIRFGFTDVIANQGVNLVRQIICISNFIPSNIYHPIGPWWFIAVIVQFYLIVPLLLKQKVFKQSNFLIFILVSSLLLEYFFAISLDQIFSININHTILGHLDLCALGMLAANHKKLSIPRWVFITAFILFIIGNFNETIWITASLSITILLIPLLRKVAAKLSKIHLLDLTMLYLGNISMYLFLCNGYLRWPLLDYAKENPTWWKNISLCLIFVVYVIAWSICLKIILNLLTKTNPTNENNG